MVTFVGTQTKFKDVIVSLLELEYDAMSTYKLVIKKLRDLECKARLSSFLMDHELHIAEIKLFYANEFVLPASGDLVKGCLVRMRVDVGNIVGSDIITLKAVLDNEKDTNIAYERVINHPKLPCNGAGIFHTAYLDEKRHKFWLENYIREHQKEH